MRVGIIGCGNISDVYVRNAKLFNNIEIVACSDILPPAAERLAHKYSLREMNVRALLAADDIEIILNLTLPAALNSGPRPYVLTNLPGAFNHVNKL